LTVYAVAQDSGLGSNMHKGFIDAALIQREVPDYKDRMLYISGPRAMVLRFRRVHWKTWARVPFSTKLVAEGRPAAWPS
jgi:NAD(P)H-flavin reductase